MIDIKLNVILHENQIKIHKGLTRFTVIKAGKRFGKTHWALYELCRAAGLKENGIFWYIAPTYRQAKSIAWYHLKWIIPRKLIRRYVETELLIELINGTRIELKGADNEDSLRGPGLDGAIFDEASYIEEYLWTGIIRGQLAGSNGFAYFISSPKKTGKNWYTNFCEDAKRRIQLGEKDWSYFFFTIKDNPTLPIEEIEALRNGVPEYVWNLEYMAQESDMAGQKYSEFSYDLNVGEYNGDKILSFYRFLDWGLDHPTVCLWAGLNNDVDMKMVYILDEYVKSGFTTSENVEVIKEKTGNRPIEWSVIDPSADRRDPNTKRSIRDEFQRWGIPCVAGDRRERGTDIVKMFLKKRMVKIHPKCKTLIYELLNLQWGDKTGDDATDALRYGLLRIHDYVNGMNVLEVENNFDRNKLNGRELSFFDKSMFPERENMERNWIMEEVA